MIQYMTPRTKSLFNKKIKCLHCSKNFKAKKERGEKVRYVCSSYDNKGECIRIPVKEEFLIELIEKRLKTEIDREVIDEYIEMITVENVDPYLLEIKFYEQESILFSKTGIRF